MTGPEDRQTRQLAVVPVSQALKVCARPDSSFQFLARHRRSCGRSATEYAADKAPVGERRAHEA